MSKNLIVFVTPREDNFCFYFVTFNLETGKEVPEYSRAIKNLITFFDRPPTWIKTSVKAIVCDLLVFWENGSVDHNFCQQLATKLNALKIPFRFMANLHITAMCKLIGAKIDPDVDKEILQIFVEKNKMKLLLLYRTENGYVITKVQEMAMCLDPEMLLESSNPSKIIISSTTSDFQRKKMIALKSCLSKWKPIVLDWNVLKYLFDAVKEIVDHMDNLENSKKYFVIPQLLDDHGIAIFDENPSKDDIDALCSYLRGSNSTKIGTKNLDMILTGINPSKDDMLIFVKSGECLPLTQSRIITRFYKKFYLLSEPEKNYRFLSHEITKDGHRFKISLSVDINNCPTITHEAVILSKIKNMPKRLKIENTQKLPIIGFFDNSSVICVWNEDKSCYKYLDSWNGKFGKDLFLDFMHSKPTLISSSTEVTSLSGAVYDLINIMSMPPENVKVESHWKFTFTENDENPLLLEFDTFENERKVATPAFLMALLLKEHIRAIRREIGEKPKKLGFRLFDDFENQEAKKRVEAGLQEACENERSNCKLYKYTKDGIAKPSLKIFSSADKKKYYSFGYLQNKKRYRCRGCDKIYAKLKNNANGEICLEMKATAPHLCKPFHY